MARSQGCPHVRLLLCLSLPLLTLAGCSSLPKGPPYCPAVPRVVPPATGPGGPLYERALAYDRLFQEKLQPRPHGGVVNVSFPAGSDPRSASAIGYDDQQDSAIWTGIYLAAQAFRYAADPAQKEDALRNARKAAETLHFFLDVTGQPGLLARFAGPMDKTALYLNPTKNGCPPPTPDAAGLCCAANHSCAPSPQDSSHFWLGGTTRDQYSGLFFGMGIAYRLIDDPELRQLIRKDLTEVVAALRKQKWMILGPDGKPTAHTASAIEPEMQAAWLLLAAEVSDDPSYCQDYERLIRDPLLGDVLLAEDDFDWTNRYMQYYGFNLTFLAFYNLIQLEPLEARKEAYQKALADHAYKEVKGTGNSFFDYIAQASGVEASPETLASAAGSLAQFPDPPSTQTCVLPPQAPLSSASIKLYEANEKLLPKEVKIVPQAERAYPLASWCRQDFLWQQSPYEICCCQVPSSEQWTPYQNVCSVTPPTDTVVFPGVDYLAAYWMGRYHHYLSPES